ncbi:MAG: cytidine deaminase [Deltaproteobacteria bacterium]|nr:cytidine deaminase [Deltaproteobacteria bacterium]
MAPSPLPWESLAKTALAARKQAYAPYSRFRVGAALLTSTGEVVTGCNVENASYGLCVCAERNAIASAVAAGHRSFVALAVATGASPPAPPCGMCRQVMAELCVDLELLLVNPAGEQRRTKLSKIFPEPFRWKGAGTRAAR